MREPTVRLPPRDVRGVIYRPVSHFADVIVGEILRESAPALPGASPAGRPPGAAVHLEPPCYSRLNDRE